MTTAAKNPALDLDAFNREYDAKIKANKEAMANGTKLNLTISGLKEHMGMDGMSFRCNLLLNGKKVGEASNDGNGGPNFYDFTSKEISKKFDADFGHEDFDGILEEMINEAALEKDFLKRANTSASRGYGLTLAMKEGRSWATMAFKTMDELEKYKSESKASVYRIIKPTVAVASAEAAQAAFLAKWKEKSIRSCAKKGLAVIFFFTKPDGTLSYVAYPKDTPEVRKAAMAKYGFTDYESVAL